MADKDILLKVENLSVHFPIHGGLMLSKVAEVRAVDGISFELRRGETLGLVGESGCGKTTVGRAIVNVLRSGTPDVEIYGKLLFNTGSEWVDLAQLSRSQMRKYRKDIQMVFQDPFSSLNPRMLVKDIIGEPLEITNPGISGKEVRDRVNWLLEKVGLSGEQALRYPHEFSGGQRQRIGIARSLATNPKLIVADEPVSALDVSIQAQVINLFQDLQEEFDLTYIFIAHDLSVVEHLSDRIAVMYLGDMVELGEGQDVYRRPLHPYSRALLAAVPLPDPSRVKTKDRKMLEGDVPNPIMKPSGCSFRTRCPIARTECAEDRPKLIERTPGHWVACPWTDPAHTPQ
ncbi:MAG: ATP-binding cassette domain-containing protein [Calditrichaeota bacterium]|nr:ATP-binding cassette domain-containing protein [Candidatus Cloacimonadota bacterium]MCB1045924.1 ATP-binding cassette domain-containing protein [Calditrichota bacterium]MCB9472681.1 ATP-binding cassette domain-containing protein [Candidatus Delongbacteria bacterium]